LGEFLGQGKTVDEVQRLLGGVAEGYFTARSAFELATEFGIEMPITEQIFRILYENKSPKIAVSELMSRDLKAEW
jgi:glycerol-3-phosphate dehydrogenase (NAD(P)+)